MLLREAGNFGAQEAAGSLDTRCWMPLTPTATRPPGRPGGEVDVTLARAPDGAWAPPGLPVSYSGTRQRSANAVSPGRTLTCPIRAAIPACAP